MTKEFFEKDFKDGGLINCYPINLQKIGFIHKDYIDGKELNEVPIRLIVYLPEKNKVGEFGRATWDYNIEQLYLANKEGWLTIDSNFQILEVSNSTSWYPIPNNEKAHLAKGMTSIDGEVYAYGMVRSVFGIGA